MLGARDFVGYYDWTFRYLEREYGPDALEQYWREAIAFDAQQHARRLFLEKGFDGMHDYWRRTLEMEEAGYAVSRSENHFRIDMFDCPSLGYLIEHGLHAYHDYCAHCIGWIGPLMKEAGFVVDHEHNHLGQCYFEMRCADQGVNGREPPPVRGCTDVRNSAPWNQGIHHLYLQSRLVERGVEE